jgi:hypothetical protein
MKVPSIAVTAAVFLLLAALLSFGAIAAGEGSLGAVEKRPGEAGAEALFNKFGSNPWRGGDPWAQSTAAHAQGFVMTFGPGPGFSTSPGGPAEVGKKVALGTIQAKTLAFCDCNNTTCSRISPFMAQGGTFRLWAVGNNTTFLGFWVELIPDGNVTPT